MALINLVWGIIGDRFGHKAVLTTAAFAVCAAPFVAYFAPSAFWMGLTFVLMGSYQATEQTSSLNIILEFGTRQEWPTYIGMTNTLLAPVLILAPLVGGTLATIFGFSTLFVVAAMVAATGALLLTLWVEEPRTTRQPLNRKDTKPEASCSSLCLGAFVVL